MAGAREPYRKMAADGTRAENAYPHRIDVLFLFLMEHDLRAPLSCRLRENRWPSSRIML
jgi:hypothetical protein